MGRWLLALMLLAAAVPGLGPRRVVAADASHPDNPPRRAIRLALLAPLTGDFQEFSSKMERGALVALAVYEPKFRRYGFDLELGEYDHGATVDPAGGPAADPVDRLMADAEVFGVVGPLTSAQAMAVAPRLEPANLALVSPTSTAVEVGQRGWKNFNQIAAVDPALAFAAATAAEDLGARSVCVIQQPFGYSVMMGQQFAARAAALGLTTSTVVMAPGLNLASIAEAEPDLIYFTGLPDKAAQVFQGLRNAGYQGDLMGTDWLATPEFVQMAGSSGDGVYYVFMAPDAVALRTTQAGKQFMARYIARFRGDRPEPVAALSYDAAAVILQATLDLIGKNGGQMPSRAEIAAAVRATTDFAGATGTVRFNVRGQNLGARGWLMQYRGGAYPAFYVQDYPTDEP